MKILHVGLMVDYRGVGLARELAKQCDVYSEIATGEPGLNQKIADLCLAHNFDFDAAFFQIQAPNIVTTEIFKYLNEKGIFTINWSGDIRNRFEPWYMQTGASLTLFSNMRDIEFMRSRGLRSDFLQIGIDDEIFKDLNTPRDQHDVVFMGNHYGHQFELGPERYQLVQWLQSRRYSVFGSYPGARGNLTGNQVEENNVYNRSKIAINYSQVRADRYTSDRMFRILGSGTFCLSHYYQGIDKDFKIGHDLDVFHSLHELENKIRVYLADASDRDRIRFNGYQLSREKFTYKSMAENIINYARNK